jgi:ribosome-binding protein aMBF1 (putative translation factor)
MGVLSMAAMIDASCSKCGRRFGWYGTMANMPACRRCGFRPPQEALDKEEAKMREMEERMLTHPKDANAETWRKQRVDAGLTLRRAAKLLGVFPKDLSAMEQGDLTPSADLLERMAKIYEVGP